MPVQQQQKVKILRDDSSAGVLFTAGQFVLVDHERARKWIAAGIAEIADSPPSAPWEPELSRPAPQVRQPKARKETQKKR